MGNSTVVLKNLNLKLLLDIYQKEFKVCSNRHFTPIFIVGSFLIPKRWIQPGSINKRMVKPKTAYINIELFLGLTNSEAC
jgi:hypothetical protein